MIKLGVTGGIGAGKSYICKMLQEHYQVPVYNCDAEAKRINEESPIVREKLTKLVGRELYCDNGKLNKPLLANYIFTSADNAADVAAIVHPIVAMDFEEWAKKQSTNIVAMESAILFESHFDKHVDYIINVTAPLTLRLERAAKRDNVAAERIKQRSMHQWTDEKRSALAHFTIVNDVNSDNQDYLKSQINKILKELC